MATLGQNIAAKALSHVGEKEQPDGSNTGPEVDGYLAYVGLPPGNPWCCAFACSMVYRTLVEMGIYTDYHPKTGSTHALLQWGEDNGCMVSTPQEGDLGCIIYDAVHGHTVVCVGPAPNDNVPTVEGNFDNAVVNNHRRIASCRWVRPYKVITPGA
jgi:hypothetical protein